MEFFINKEMLISNNEWISHINSFKNDSELTEPENKIASELQRLLENAIKKRIENVDCAGIFFSGGLDSSHITALCKKLGTNFRCYTVGFQDGNFKEPEDIGQAKSVARFLNLDNEQFLYKVFDINEMQNIILKTVKILNYASKEIGVDINNVVNVGVGAVELAAQGITKGEKFFFSGLGSEELFAGYERHRKNPSNEECFSGLLSMYERDLLRDNAISKTLGFKFLTPFLDDELVKYALRIPIKYKINNTGNKLILRKAAYPLLKEFSERPKKAAQYGSSFDKAISKLASMNGYKTKKDYIKSL